MPFPFLSKIVLKHTQHETYHLKPILKGTVQCVEYIHSVVQSISRTWQNPALYLLNNSSHPPPSATTTLRPAL